MFKSLLSLALAVTSTVGLAAPAQAHELRTDSTVKSVTALLETATDLGIRIRVEIKDCKDNPVLMGYMQAPAMVMTLCVENHSMYGNATDAAIADTVRHELIHAAQFCNATWSDEILFPNALERSFRIAQDHLGWDASKYHPDHWNSEAEARAVTHELSDSEVGQLLDNRCRFQDTNRSMVGEIRAGRLPIKALKGSHTP